jgi:phospholipase C
MTSETSSTSDTPGPSRRLFLGGAAATAATAAVLGAASLPASAATTTRAATPAAKRKTTGTMADIEHVVILMQENRSVDHYYGSMRGVRGFGDKTVLTLPNGQNVFHQPDPARPDGGYLLPYHVDTFRVDGQDLTGNDHTWGGVHEQWADGANTGFVADNGDVTMSFFTAKDVPFNRALAQAFTFCDHYFCSIKGPTTPNRLFHWTGTIDPHGKHGGPAIFNPDDYLPVYIWTTYPERLQRAGISWQVYANDEVGDGGGADGFVGDYGDNPLWLFQAYHDALASASPAEHQLADRASLRTTWKPNSGLGKDVNHVLAQFIAAAQADALPQVSWIVAPYAYSEHPQARPVDGAAYTQAVLNAIWSTPGLWEKTAVFINYDEHDGFFDHVISPTAPAGTKDEFVDGLPVGLGPRVPMTVVSPWSRGGWINSQVFDHTSVLRFLELWTGVDEPNISDWRREISGDLTSCFDFRHPDWSIPVLPDTTTLRKQADARDKKLPSPTAPAPGEQVVPQQEPGTAPARALPYQPWSNVSVGASKISVGVGNTGSATVQLQVYNTIAAGLTSQRLDVGAGATDSVDLPIPDAYSVAVHGPNGFLRLATGARSLRGFEVTTELTGSASHPKLRVTLTNGTSGAVSGQVAGAGSPSAFSVSAGGSRAITIDPLTTSSGWYDVGVTITIDATFLRRFAGHLENGHASITG